jgi:hypothetical protein
MTTNRTKYLYHVTHKNNWMSIGITGLLADYSVGARPGVWLVTSGKLTWAVTHTMKRHGYKQSDLIVVRVRVRRDTLRKNKVRGAWYSVVDIPPRRIEWVKHWPSLNVARITRGTLRIMGERSYQAGGRYE